MPDVVITLDGNSRNGVTINSLVHPLYNKCYRDWEKFRYVWEGGECFIEKYLERYSSRETKTDFEVRKRLTYTPGHASTAVLEVKNSIYERFVDISRSGGSDKYQSWVKGDKGGVDGADRSMDQFIGTICLPELLVTSRVGVYVDAPKMDMITKADEENFMPYAYMYKAEDIRTWARGTGRGQELSAVLLRDTVYTYDDNFGLITGTETRFRLLKKENRNGKDVVVAKYFERGGKELSEEEDVLDIPEIPFEFVEIDHSILKTVADHQIALLNLASADLHYCLKANFPFYTEQQDPRTNMDLFTSGGDDFSEEKEGTASNAAETDDKTAEIGVMNGRAYPMNADRPGFIHPSSEPLKASMAKQEEIRMEVRQLVLLSVSSLNPNAPRGERDDQGLEAGLAYIGMTLEYLERKIAKFFAMYENAKNIKDATVQYPADYRVRSEEDRRKEAEQLLEILPQLPSLTYQKETAKRVADLTIGHWVSIETMDKIHKEIDDAKIVNVDPEKLLADLQAGILSEATASKARLYPDSEITQARVDHVERLKRIVISQTKGQAGELQEPAARGVKDADPNEDSAEEEKEDSQNADKQEDRKKATRGPAK